MDNIAYNGFGCPSCRKQMTNVCFCDCETNSSFSEYNNNTDDYMLTSFRIFHQQINGEEITEEDTIDNEINEEHNEESNYPDFSYVSQKLLERNISFEDLVKHILHELHDYNSSNYREHSDETYGKFRSIIHTYIRNLHSTN
jgi:hypothetical protein